MNDEVEVKIKLLPGGAMPEKKTAGAACFDCMARERVDIPAGKRCLVPLGFCMELPPGWEAVIRPRSGLTGKSVDSMIGTIDSDYRGEVKACIVNNLGEGCSVEPGTLICQLAVRPAPAVHFVQVTELSSTDRGTDGFGSTGLH